MSTRTLLRRTVLAAAPISMLVQAQTPSVTLGADFPREDSQLAREIVTAAHTDEKKVRALVEARPSLVNAWWDWGFGDWESSLGAASHMGRRTIAEFLIEKGARIDIFAAAMLGMTDVVKAFVLASPGIQRTLGPHGIPLLAHAKAGGAKTAFTVKYLEELGDAGNLLSTVPFAEERKAMITGRYVLDGREIEVKVAGNGSLQIESQAREGYRTPRNLFHQGDDTFFPSGVPSVRFRFEIRDGKAESISISNPSGSVGVARRAS